jgi:hypothetical protein
MDLTTFKKFYYTFPVTAYVLAAIGAVLAVLLIEGWPAF